MNEFLIIIALFVAIEGLLYAAFPHAMKRAMSQTAQLSPDTLRITGLISAIIGVMAVWLIKAWG
jgi:uncharacterized protein